MLFGSPGGARINALCIAKITPPTCIQPIVQVDHRPSRTTPSLTTTFFQISVREIGSKEFESSGSLRLSDFLKGVFLFERRKKNNGQG